MSGVGRGANDWNIGDLIQDTYEVKQVHEGGGMGLVYRVHHRNWDIDLAVKKPRPDYFKTEQQKLDFVSECEAWMGLGVHPHTVTCYYVVTMGSTPHVFAEYVTGGSLSDWIRSRRLYVGGSRKSLARILDVAIQSAWGLHYAHERGLIHQDVKPGNILMSESGDAKITDFGLARATATVQGIERGDQRRSIVASTGGMTPAYCSPEQACGRQLTRRTDIYSWAVSVLEMHAGEVSWLNGQAAAAVFDNAAASRGPSGVALPAAVQDCLRKCLASRQEDRPHDFVPVVSELIRSYEDLFQTAYQRSVPEQQELDVDTLNNKILSMVDLGKMREAVSLIADLRRSRPDHVYGRLNDALFRWRKLGVSIAELNRLLDNAYSSPFMPDIKQWQVMLELEKCDTVRASRILKRNGSDEEAELKVLIEAQNLRLRGSLEEFFREESEGGSLRLGEPLRTIDDTRPTFVMGSAASGRVVFRTDIPRLLAVRCLRTNRELCKIECTHDPSHMSMSEDGELLVLACVERSRMGQGQVRYHVSVHSTTAGTLVGTYEGDIPRVNIAHVTIDNHGKCVTLWLWDDRGWYELVHDLEGNGIVRPFRCDFRRPSVHSEYDQIYVNGDRTLLMGVRGSSCILWRYPSATQDDGMNILDIDLANFGLSDMQKVLPGLEMGSGCDYRIGAWNGHDLMKLLAGLVPTSRTEYLVCRPKSTTQLYQQSRRKEGLLCAAENAVRAKDLRAAIKHMNQLCEVPGAYEDSLMSWRHNMVRGFVESHVERVWHSSENHYYWEQTGIYGMYSDRKDRIVVQGVNGVQGYVLPGMIEDSASTWHSWMKDDSNHISLGIRLGDNGQCLSLLHERDEPYRASLAFYDGYGTSEVRQAWTVAFKTECRGEEGIRSALRKVVCLKDNVFVELEPGVVSILDWKTGLERVQARIGGAVSFLKRVQTRDGQECVFAACMPCGTAILGRDGRLCEQGAAAENVVPKLRPVEDVALDLSSVIGWRDKNRLVHVSIRGQTEVEVWNRWSSPQNGPRSMLCEWEPFAVVSTACGRALAYLIGDQLVVYDVQRHCEVFRWRYPWGVVNGLAFDASARWLVLTHSGNNFEVFQLLWNVGEPVSL